MEEENNRILWPETKPQHFTRLSQSTFCSWGVGMTWVGSVLSAKNPWVERIVCKGTWCLNTAKQVSPNFKQFQLCFHRNVSGFAWSILYLYDCRNDRFRKNSMGSISITASFRGNLPCPGDNHLVLFTMAVCVYRNASGHATNWIRQGNSYGFWCGIPILMWTNGIWSCLMIRWSTPVKTKRITRGSYHRNLSVTYIVQNLFHQGKGSRSINLNSHYLVLFRNSRSKLQILTLAKQINPGQTDFFLNQYEEAVKRPVNRALWLVS